MITYQICLSSRCRPFWHASSINNVSFLIYVGPDEAHEQHWPRDLDLCPQTSSLVCTWSGQSPRIFDYFNDKLYNTRCSHFRYMVIVVGIGTWARSNTIVVMYKKRICGEEIWKTARPERPKTCSPIAWPNYWEIDSPGFSPTMNPWNSSERRKLPSRWSGANQTSKRSHIQVLGRPFKAVN